MPTTPTIHPSSAELQAFGTTIKRSIVLQHTEALVEMLNQVLSDALTLRDLYKKHHWQVSGPAFYQLHLLFDKHHEQAAEIVDLIAERIQTLGGVSVAMGADACELTRIPRPPRGRETPTAQIRRLIEAHEIVIGAVRAGAKLAADRGDDGTNDLLIGGVLRVNEMQVWFLSEHLAGTSTAEGA
jgi:starvation-inducible DNA-binding protein